MTDQAMFGGEVRIGDDRPPAPAGGGAGSSGTATRVVLILTAVLSILVPALASVDLGLPGRPLLAVLFMLAVPGVPIAMALRLPSRLITAALAVATSLSFDVIYGTAAIVSDWWHPVAGAWIAALIGLAVTVVVLRRLQATPDAVGSERVSPGAAVARFTADRTRLVLLGLLIVAAVLWWLETRVIDLDQTSSLGLLPAIGWRYVLALVIVAVVILCALVRPRVDHVVLTGAALLVAFIGFATVSIADGEGSVPVGWVHVGFTQYISENGAVPPSVDARFSWPGFFAAAAQLVSLAGTPDARTFLVLAPIVYFLIALPALLMIARCITRSWRWSWVAIFVFLFTNWYQQDYFSPQATAFVIYVAIIATLLWMVETSRTPLLGKSLAAKVRGALTRTPGLPTGVSVGTAQALGILLAALIIGIVVDHQLTPVNLIFALVAFTVTGLTRYRMLWLVAGLALAGWFSYGAVEFWIGHLGGILGEVGEVGNAVTSSVSSRLTGDPTYQRAQYVRIGWSVLLFGTAVVGAWFLRRRRQLLLFAGLSVAPFGLLLVQSYGGEVVIRCFLYASPVLSAMAAIGLRGAFGLLTRARAHRQVSTRSSRSRTIWAVVLVPAVVVAGLVLTFTRGLNVSFERTPEGQAEASQLMYDQAADGTSVGLPFRTGLSPYLRMLEVRPRYLDALDCDPADIVACLDGTTPDYVLVTLTQDRYGELTESRPEGWVWTYAQTLIDSGLYTRIFTAHDAWLLQRVPEGATS